MANSLAVLIYRKHCGTFIEYSQNEYQYLAISYSWQMFCTLLDSGRLIEGGHSEFLYCNLPVMELIQSIEMVLNAIGLFEELLWIWHVVKLVLELTARVEWYFQVNWQSMESQLNQACLSVRSSFVWLSGSIIQLDLDIKTIFIHTEGLITGVYTILVVCKPSSNSQTACITGHLYWESPAMMDHFSYFYGLYRENPLEVFWVVWYVCRGFFHSPVLPPCLSSGDITKNTPVVSQLIRPVFTTC